LVRSGFAPLAGETLSVGRQFEPAFAVRFGLLISKRQPLTRCCLMLLGISGGFLLIGSWRFRRAD